MTVDQIAKHIDYTQLKAYSTWSDIQALCDEAAAHRAASVCIPPCFVAPVRQRYSNAIRICTVIGFPLGYSATAVKVFEAGKALEDGADEIDMVVNIGDVKMGRWDSVLAEVSALREATRGHILKVIVETCYETEEEKTRLCRIVSEAGADYIKTSTGFGPAGATLDDVRLFKANIGPKVKIKAAGGIRTKAAMEAYLEAGCDRIGASAKFSTLEN